MQQQDQNNAKIAYEYTESLLKATNEGVDRINNRLTTTLGSSAVVLSFSYKLSDSYLSLALTKIIACIILVLVIFLCLYALRPKKTGEVVNPKDLLDDYWFYKEEYLCRLYIGRAWKEAIEVLEDLYDKKAHSLKWAYIGLSISAFLIGLNIAIKTSLVQPGGNSPSGLKKAFFQIN